MTVTTKLKVGTTLLRVAGHAATERLPRRAVASPFPIRAADLTPPWLTEVLCAGHPGAAVTGVELGASNDGTTSRRPFTVAYNPAGVDAGLPTALFAKSTTEVLSRMLVGTVHAVRSEAGFYRDLRPRLPIEAPNGYRLAFDERSWRSMFILDDVGRSRGAAFCDTGYRIDRAAAESMMRQLARVHGSH